MGYNFFASTGILNDCGGVCKSNVQCEYLWSDNIFHRRSEDDQVTRLRYLWSMAVFDLSVSLVLCRDLRSVWTYSSDTPPSTVVAVSDFYQNYVFLFASKLQFLRLRTKNNYGFSQFVTLLLLFAGHTIVLITVQQQWVRNAYPDSFMYINRIQNVICFRVEDRSLSM